MLNITKKRKRHTSLINKHTFIFFAVTFECSIRSSSDRLHSKVAPEPKHPSPTQTDDSILQDLMEDLVTRVDDADCTAETKPLKTPKKPVLRELNVTFRLVDFGSAQRRSSFRTTEK